MLTAILELNIVSIAKYQSTKSLTRGLSVPLVEPLGIEKPMPRIQVLIDNWLASLRSCPSSSNILQTFYSGSLTNAWTCMLVVFGDQLNYLFDLVWPTMFIIDSRRQYLGITKITKVSGLNSIIFLTWKIYIIQEMSWWSTIKRSHSSCIVYWS